MEKRCEAGIPGNRGRALLNDSYGTRKRGRGVQPRRGSRLEVVLALAALVLSASAHAAEWDTLEYAVKATFVYKFAPFVTWPADVRKDGAFPICASGSDRVAPLIPAAVRGQEVDGGPINVRQIKSPDEIQGCAILYIAAPDSSNARDLLAATRGKPILTITDAGGDAHGIIDFRVVDGHVRFDIDENLAAEGGLTISSKLLSLASAVDERPQR